MPTIHLFEVSIPVDEIPKFIRAMENIKASYRDTKFIRVSDLEAFITGSQTGIDDDFNPRKERLSLEKKYDQGMHR